MDDIRHVIVWYLTLTALGWLGFPIAYRLLPALKDRGYSLSRTLGLLLWGYIFWMLASLGVVQNDPAGLLFAAALLGLLTLWALRGVSPQELRAWLRSQRAMVIIVEALFLLAFAGWAWVRAANPEAVGTEKPMELAFINAILGSKTFPPHDPWLSGYAISYYYFGYVLVAMLARLAETSGAVAFNLGICAVFALTASGAYGLVFNLTNACSYERTGRHDLARPRYTLAALLAPLFILIVSNLEGFLHLLHTWGVFWQRTPAGMVTSNFWTWLDINDLNQPPTLPSEELVPTRFWWWWRASRVLQDYDLAGKTREIIDEFPFFSYLLSDLHPHVLAMPFGMLAIGLALNLFLGGSRTTAAWPKWQARRSTLAMLGALAAVLGVVGVALGAFRLMRAYSTLANAGVMAAASAGGAGGLFLALLGAILAVGGGLVYMDQSGARLAAGREAMSGVGEKTISFGIPLYISPSFALLAAVALGGLAFLNTWDFPVYVALTAAAYALGRVLQTGRSIGGALQDFALLGLTLGIAGIALYWPFYLGFSSQAGGLLPNVIYPTRGAHLWVMFAPLLLPALAWLTYLARRAADRKILKRGFWLAAGLLTGLWALSLLLAALIIVLPEAGGMFLSSIAAQSPSQVFTGAFQRRLQNSGGWLTLLILLTPILALLASQFERRSGRADVPTHTTEPAEERSKRRLEHTEVFALLLALTGGLLIAGPEFFFLRDLFGWRMNTIFKFYFQAWQILGLLAAYGSIVLLVRLRGVSRSAFGLGLIVLLAAALVYPILSLDSKTGYFNPLVWTLDSSNYFARQYPDEMAAVQWLQAAPMGVIAEAVPPQGGSYSEYARAGTLSGKPSVLGWVGHENQWRGESSATAVGARQGDLQQLYCTRAWSEAQAILDRYHIRYVVVGQWERANYVPDSGQCPSGLVEAKFQRSLKQAFQAGGVTIYEYAGETHD